MTSLQQPTSTQNSTLRLVAVLTAVTTTVLATTTFGGGGLRASAATTTIKKATTTKPAGAVAAGSTVAKGTSAKSAQAQTKKAPKVVQPGKDFVGWEQRGKADWPSDTSAAVIEPLGKTILVRKTPDYSTPGILLGSGTSVSGSLGLLVVGESAGWWKVLLPVRPNGTVGWVEATTVKTRLVRERIVVDLASNTLTLMVNGKATRTESVATGTSGTPTPDGLFFVKSIVPQTNPAGGRGPFVLVLSAFSDVLNSFDGGQGAVGIHGTSAPGKLGQDVSHGCVRTKNDAIVYFAKNLRPGTPVEIHGRASDAPGTRWSTPATVLEAPGGLLVPAGATTTAKSTAPPGSTSGTMTATTVVGANPDKSGGTTTTSSTTTTVAGGENVESVRPPITGLPG